jgi:Zn-dependent oligopeptidase
VLLLPTSNVKHISYTHPMVWQAGLSDEKQVREVGRRFRDTVLAMGGGAHPTEVYEKFRGR